MQSMEKTSEGEIFRPNKFYIFAFTIDSFTYQNIELLSLITIKPVQWLNALHNDTMSGNH